MYSNSNVLPRQALILKMLIASILILVWVGCTSAPSETPEKVVLNFIQKHIPLLDQSVADFYVKEEQAGVIDRVKNFIASARLFFNNFSACSSIFGCSLNNLLCNGSHLFRTS